MGATQSIQEHLKPDKKSHGSAWWRDANFVPGVVLPCGCENFSPVQFPQGHIVCSLSTFFLDWVLSMVSW